MAAVLRGTRDGAAVLGPCGTLRRGNRRFARLLGLPVEELPGLRLDQVMETAEAAEMVARVRAGRRARGTVLLGVCGGLRSSARFAVEPLPDGGAVLLAGDMGRELRLERERNALRAVAMGVALANGPVAALEVTLRVLCDGQGWLGAAGWLPRAGGITPVIERSGARRARSGAAGTAARRAFAEVAPAWEPDDDVAGAAGVLAIPVLVGQEAAAVLAVWAPREPELRDVALLTDASALLGTCLSRLGAEARRAAALAEREVLLREVHHRVRNNLQVVSCLLQLQARTIGEAGGRAALETAERRVRAMARVHETLSAGTDLANIPVDQLAEDRLALLPSGVASRVSLAQVSLPLDLAVPFALLLEELLTWATLGTSPIRVGLSSPDAWVVLEVGRGEPGEDGDVLTPLVRTLVRELAGTLDRVPGPMPVWRLVFPAPCTRSCVGADEGQREDTG